MQHIIDRKFPKGAALNRLDSNTVNYMIYAINSLHSTHTKTHAARQVAEVYDEVWPL
ncbi:hypothetical protein F5B17DRAFT_395243 [Nemania serpens]|nr:hypothetical protein F5B17DRAFT_395243 [Nemania serpens]